MISNIQAYSIKILLQTNTTYNTLQLVFVQRTHNTHHAETSQYSPQQAKYILHVIETSQIRQIRITRLTRLHTTLHDHYDLHVIMTSYSQHRATSVYTTRSTLTRLITTRHTLSRPTVTTLHIISYYTLHYIISHHST